MHAYLLEYGNLLLRWLHVIAAVAWIGESIYFVMLDNGLKPPKGEESKKRGVFGEMWAVHGGGFYHNQKYLTNPAELPDDLHWSFWKSYTTWLSGFGLFALLYLTKPEFYLVNPSSPWEWAAQMTGTQANVVAIAFLVLGWVVYNGLCRLISPNMERDGILSVAVAIMMVAVAYLSAHIFSGRAAFLLTGAVMATSMSANVFFWIIPGQRRMVKALKAGLAPNPLDGKRGKQRSVHNTYFTLPVLLLMLSNHYSFTYNHPNAWIIMVLFIFAGALIRQYFVLLHGGTNNLAYPVAGAILLVIVGWVAAPASVKAPAQNAAVSADDSATKVSLARVQEIMDGRCIQCHAAKPSAQFGFPSAPAGMLLDTKEHTLLHAAQVKNVVGSHYMPLGNMTQMTEEERAEIAAWSGKAD